MKSILPDRFTHAHVIADDGALSFACETDNNVWPWLALDPFDPIVVQTLNYYAAYEIALARGEYDPGQWTALTQTAWTCGEVGAGHAVRGMAFPLEDDGPGYRMHFFDRDDALVYRMSGKGVVFKNRNFEVWRKQQKQELDTGSDARDFPYVPAEAVGVATQIESYLSALDPGGGQSATGLVTLDNGFLPEHPYHSGSGDHVNATHLADACRQFIRLLHGAPTRAVIGGEMQFQRFVELGCPFRIELVEESQSRNTVTLAVQQADTHCATLVLGYARGV